MAGASIKTEAGLQQLDQLLASRSYIGSDLAATEEDFKVHEAVSHTDYKQHPHVARWYRHIASLKVKFPHRPWSGGSKMQLPAGGQPQKAGEAQPKADAKPQKEEQPKKQEPKAKAAPKAAAGASAAPSGGTPPADEDDEAAAKVQLLVGKVTKVWEHPDSDKLFCEEIDCGEPEVRQIGSGLRHFYKAEEFEGRMVVVVANLKPKKLANFPSNGMVLCASNADHTDVKFVDVPAGAKVGDRVMFGDLAMQEAAPPNACEKKKLFIKTQPHFTTKGGVAMYKNQPLIVPAGQCTAPVADGWSLS